MKTARDDVLFWLSAADTLCNFDLGAGAHSTLCDRLTAAAEARDREVIEACAEVADGWCDHSDACVKAIRSLSPKGTA